VRGELAERDRAVTGDRGQRRLARRTETALRLLPQPAVEPRDGKPEPPGQPGAVHRHSDQSQICYLVYRND